jgi:amidase
MQWFAAAGPMARWVEDLELTLSILSGPDGVDPACAPVPLADSRAVDIGKLRIAFHTDNGIVTPTAETIETVRQAAQAMARAGAQVDEARPSGIEQSFEIFFALFAADGGAGTRHLIELCGTEKTHPMMENLLAMLGEGFPPAMFGGLLARISMFQREMLRFLANYDVILCPTNAFPAVEHGTHANPNILPGFSYTAAFNLTGWPGSVVRCGTSPEGLPIGVQAVARPWREDVALAVAGHLEDAFGGWKAPELNRSAANTR